LDKKKNNLNFFFLLQLLEDLVGSSKSLLEFFNIFLGVEADEDWSLFCPNEAPGLHDSFGPAFEELYVKYERQGKARKVVKAQKLWFAIIDAQVIIISINDKIILTFASIKKKKVKQHYSYLTMQVLMNLWYLLIISKKKNRSKREHRTFYTKVFF